ncbi:MAG TPA: class I SAM-dependent methyltransferase [Terriglobales bacterium]|jgi:SAM-dependent methyltransferase|nr:class I SAM-dependent methyltransferase [Terriglobales bacterium]
MMQPQLLAAAEISKATSMDLSKCVACGHIGAEPFLKAPDRFHARPKIYSLVQCPQCSLVWLEDPPPLEDMGEHYGPDYDALIAESGETSPEHWHPRRDMLLQQKQGGALLDLGCSSGAFLSLIKGPKWQLYGIEISEDSATRARSRTGAEVFVGDVLAASFPDGEFDAVSCFHVFEHMYMPQAVLGRVWRWLKPGGVFVAEMPNIHCQEARFFQSYWYPLELPRHLYHFSPAAFRALAANFGFEEVRLTTMRARFVDYHLRYLGDTFWRSLGRPRRPMMQDRPGLAWRMVRKMLRLGVYPALSWITSSRGDASMMQVVLRKPEAGCSAQ